MDGKVGVSSSSAGLIGLTVSEFKLRIFCLLIFGLVLLEISENKLISRYLNPISFRW